MVLRGAWRRAVLAGFIAIAGALSIVPAHGQDKATLAVSAEQGFGRLILTFPDRLDLPEHQIKLDNGVLAITFTEPVEMSVPDVSGALGEYVGIARLDPDKKGLRLGLRQALMFHSIEAGERLFVDLMPATWSGLPPSLPPEIVAELTQRSIDAGALAEQRRKAEEAELLHPVAQLRVGKHPTFNRIQFDWSIAAEAKFELDGETAYLDFDWPVAVDLYALKADLPPEILSVENEVTPDGSRIAFELADGVAPRFYATSETQFLIDIDADNPITEDEPVDAANIEVDHKGDHDDMADAGEMGLPDDLSTMHPDGPATRITPYVTEAGATVRIVVPFEEETAAAVFRRGDSIWMIFDTMVGIDAPEKSALLDSVASGFTAVPAGSTQVIRLDLSVDRLATLGSEGKAWVLSLGDSLLVATEPLSLDRRRSGDGEFEIVASFDRPSMVHQFLDPVVGDLLEVVTAFPPARGVLRKQEFVDFTALTSIHGLVLKPERDGLEVAIEDHLAIIGSTDGLEISPLDRVRVTEFGDQTRDGFIDLRNKVQDDPQMFDAARGALLEDASRAEGADRDRARLELARLYLANQFGQEALGVLRVLDDELKTESLRKDVRLAEAAANIVAHRPDEALAILTLPAFADNPDAQMWRTIARADVGDFDNARADATASEAVIETYPSWVRSKFYLAAIRAAIETNEPSLASRFFEGIEFAKLTLEETNIYTLLTGRLAEVNGDVAEAIDTYGRVIAADFRPTRAEAVYRTLLLLDSRGTIDLAKATATLSAETMLWRGDALEANMQKLLADLYFRNRDYRLGFETVMQAAHHFPDSSQVSKMASDAQAVFTRLFLDGEADALDPVAALGIYYDFRQLTPPGARGDEMIRNLAQRLVKVDLLSQAADLLRYQVDNRLKGAARSQVATDLAVIEIADRQPEAALLALNQTRSSDLSPTLERQRRILEARALIDADRFELALDLLSSVDGRDADLLRVDAHWAAKRYRDAGELLEVLYSNDDLQSPIARMNIIKAAVGFVLDGDKLGLSRLRSKFGEALSQTPEWAMFDFVTGEVNAQSIEFRKVAREISGLDGLNAFLEAYRQIYGGDDAALTPMGATPLDQQV